MRIQQAGARYHVINRGNYRGDIFADEGAVRAFLSVLEGTVGRYGWRLHAYVLMRNHYHLAVETPEPNLVAGMHWMQGTFCNRFNRFRKQNGHVFQGRYKAIILEDANALARVVDYIHLNPVRASAVRVAEMERYPWSSLRELLKKKRIAGLVCEDWLKARGGWGDNARGRRDYLHYLRELGADEAQQKREGLVKMSRGWALGTRGWKEALARELANKVYVEGMPKEEIEELREMRWNEILTESLGELGMKEADVKKRPRFQIWKLRIAARLRKKGGVPVAWIAEKLQMGKPSSLRSYLTRFKINE
jgi:REP element-mobilizing transposase RayT